MAIAAKLRPAVVSRLLGNTAALQRPLCAGDVIKLHHRIIQLTQCRSKRTDKVMKLVFMHKIIFGDSNSCSVQDYLYMFFFFF